MKTNPLRPAFCNHIETGILHLIAVHGHEGETFHQFSLKQDGSREGWARTSHGSRYFSYDYPEHDAPEMLRVQMFGHSVTIDTSCDDGDCRDVEETAANAYAGEY